MAPLSNAEIEDRPRDSDWNRGGDEIVREWKLADVAAAIEGGASGRR